MAFKSQLAKQNLSNAVLLSPIQQVTFREQKQITFLAWSHGKRNKLPNEEISPAPYEVLASVYIFNEGKSLGFKI